MAEQKGLWPDGSSGAKRILACDTCGNPRDLCEDRGCDEGRLGELTEMLVVPAALAAELAEALESVCAVGDRAAVQTAAPALARYRGPLRRPSALRHQRGGPMSSKTVVTEEAVKDACASFERNEWTTGEFPESAMREALEAAAPAIRQQERQRVREALVTHVGEWALRMIKKGADVTSDDWEELRRLVQVAEVADTDDLCTCGHVRHEHHTWNENASVGCGHCGCEQFHLDLDTLEDSDGR